MITSTSLPTTAARTARWRSYYRMVDRLSDEHLPQNYSGFGLIDRKVVDEVVKIEDYSPYIRGLIASVGFNQACVPYERGQRRAGRSKHGFAFLMEFGLNG